jgi:hypothetical protein
VTCGIDAFGRDVAKIEENSNPEAKALEVLLPLTNYTTLYEKTGDYFVVFASLGFITFYFIGNYKKYLNAKDKNKG